MKKYISILMLLCISAFAFTSCLDNAGNNPPETETNTPETTPITLELTAAEEEEITALIKKD